MFFISISINKIEMLKEINCHTVYATIIFILVIISIRLATNEGKLFGEQENFQKCTNEAGPCTYGCRYNPKGCCTSCKPKPPSK